MAAVLFVGTFGFWGLVWLASRSNVSLAVDGAWLLWAVVLVSVGLPAVQAYQNDGLVISVALGLSIPLAFYSSV